MMRHSMHWTLQVMVVSLWRIPELVQKRDAAGLLSQQLCSILNEINTQALAASIAARKRELPRSPQEKYP